MILLVTGASRGIGRETCRRYFDDGRFDTIVGVARSFEEKCEKIGKKTRIDLSADLSTKKGIRRVTAFLDKAFGEVGAVVNNAGEVGGSEFVEISLSQLERQIRLHLSAHLVLSNAAYKSRHKDGLTIINVGSVYGDIAVPQIATYCLSKAAVPLLTRMQAIRYGADVKVNAILPGHIDTNMTRAAPKEFIKEIIASTPQQRIGDAGDVVDVIEYLLSSNSDFITGSCITIDGGFSSKFG